MPAGVQNATGVIGAAVGGAAAGVSAAASSAAQSVNPLAGPLPFRNPLEDLLSPRLPLPGAGLEIFPPEPYNREGDFSFFQRWHQAGPFEFGTYRGWSPGSGATSGFELRIRF